MPHCISDICKLSYFASSSRKRPQTCAATLNLTRAARVSIPPRSCLISQLREIFRCVLSGSLSLSWDEISLLCHCPKRVPDRCPRPPLSSSLQTSLKISWTSKTILLEILLLVTSGVGWLVVCLRQATVCVGKYFHTQHVLLFEVTSSWKTS